MAALVLVLVAFAGVAHAGRLFRFVDRTVNSLMLTILPPGEVNPSNMAVVDGDLMLSRMREQPAAQMVRVHDANQAATGRGIVVAVLDAGWDLSHPIFEGRLTPFAYDAIDRDDDPNDLGNGRDDSGRGYPDHAVGHGNFVAGMVLLAAPEATIMPIRIMDDEGYGNNDALVRGLRFAMDMGADVINISAQAGFYDSWEVESELQRAYDRGILVVASAGNEGKSDLGVIAGHSTTIATGATDNQAVIADFSNDEGWFQDLTFHAPGVELEGPMAHGAMGVWSGTSFSSGVASGAAAVYLELHPHTHPAEMHGVFETAVNPVWERDGRQARHGLVDLFQVVYR